MNKVTYQLLLLIRSTSGIDGDEIVLRCDVMVFVVEHSLKLSETLVWIRREVEVHSCFMVFQLRPALKDACKRHV